MGQVTMPKMGEAMEEGTLIRWLKKVGDPIEENEPIAEVETDKTAMEVLSFVGGTVRKLLINEGEVVPVGGVIALVGDGDEEPASAAPVPAESEPVASASAAPAPFAASTGETLFATDDRPLASPLARRIAEASGVDLRTIRGTGPNGRIIEADVKEFLLRSPAVAPPSIPASRPAADAPKTLAADASKPLVADPPKPPAVEAPKPPVSAPVATATPASSGEERKLSRMRQIIARRLTESKRAVPHFYVTTDIDMKAAKEFHASLKTVEREGRPRPTLTDMMVKAVALALEKRPELNAQFHGETILFPSQINVGVAVSLEEGLIVPVIKGCESKTLHQIARDSRPLIEKARSGKLTPEEYGGGTFTISNLGMYDVENFSAIINPPECAILAVSSILDQVVAVNGEIAIRPRMKVTLSADHRVADGVKAAQFLQELKRLLQAPISLVE